MDSTPVILEYEPSTARLTTRLARRTRALALGLWLRKPWPAELLVVPWLALCAANVVQAVRDAWPPVSAWPWLAYLAAPMAGGFWGLVRQRRWRGMLVCAGILAATGIASGMVQVTSCPHASYLHVERFYIAVSGDPCRNDQSHDFRPWWLP